MTNLEPLHALLDEVVDVTLLDGRRQVQAGQQVGVLIATVPGKSERDHRKFVLKKREKM
jgi:hypothetical protein